MHTYCFDHKHQTIHLGQLATPLRQEELQDLLSNILGNQVINEYHVADGVAVIRVPKDLTDLAIDWTRKRNPRLRWARSFEGEALRALGVLHHRESMRFHPVSGEKLHHSDYDLAARTADGKQVFPRIDPSVIGTIELHKPGHLPRLLLGRNAMRPDYFSLVAGYVEVGENFEQAFIREAMEEAGIRISQVEYVESQAWPFSGSIMVGMRAVTFDEHPVGERDGELLETVWATASDVLSGLYNLPRPGSISLKLILQWANDHKYET